MGRLDGKVALITGGARGQGRSHALRLAEDGAQIIVCDIARQIESVPYALGTEEDLQETVRLVEALDRRCLAVRADARSDEEMAGVVEQGIAEFGHIDIAAINHGIAVPGRWDTPVEVIDDILAVNLKGALIASRAVIPHMIERGGGSIVLTSSTAGIGPSPGLVAYSMSKHGVIGLMRCLSAGLAEHRIRVNTICPGSVRTDMLMNDAVISMFCGVPTGGTPQRAEFAARSLNLLPEPWSDPRDISDAVAFLASDDARTITGIVMPVDLGNSNQPSGVPSIAAAALAAASRKP